VRRLAAAPVDPVERRVKTG